MILIKYSVGGGVSTAAQRSLAWGGMVSGGRRSAKVKEEGEERGRGSGGNEWEAMV